MPSPSRPRRKTLRESSRRRRQRQQQRAASRFADGSFGVERLEPRAMLAGYAMYNLVNTSDTYALVFEQGTEQAEVDAARKDAIAYEHQVHRLHAQMNPHFLFNALNAVVAFRHSPDDVARVTQDLADFLRSALRDSRLLEPLAREIQTLEMYLAVQQTRFGEKLDCRIVCDRKARGVMVPPMIVQPLLENAIAYGMQTSETSLRVDISARVDEGTLEIAVVNSGTWIEPDPTRSPGTGLKTLRKRLALLIGPSASVTVDPAVPLAWASNGTCVRVTIRMPVANNTESSPFANSLLQESMT